MRGPHRLPVLPSAASERGDEELRRIEHELRLALSEIRYGSIEIVIQDSRVVQIERREKVRFDREGREGR
ncbi:MAG: YezD family protein [Thermoanaerobaculia bacterium]